MATRAGIRELRQYLSRYIDLVKAGETIEVTERGRPVAVLVPHVAADPLAALERRGLRVTRASLGLESLGRTPARRSGQRAPTDLLAEQRERGRY